MAPLTDVPRFLGLAGSHIPQVATRNGQGFGAVWIDLGLLALCGALCFVPVWWICLPAGAVILLWMPGRLVVGLLDRVRSAAGRSWMAVGASLVLMPVPLSWAWHIFNRRAVILGCVVVVNLALIVLSLFRRPGPSAARMFPSWRSRAVLSAIILWTGLCVFGTYWIPTAGDRIATVAAHDYIKHHAVMLSLERYALPLHNFFYAAEADTPYYYYEYHHLVPAALRALTGNCVSIAFAFGLTSAAVSAVFIAMVFVIARDLLDSVRGALLSAACVSIIGGWDIIPVLARVATGGAMVVTLDAWCPVIWRMHNLLTQYIWCPQHISAVVALMLCCRWLHYAPSARWWVIVAPLLGTSIFGSSVYLSMTIFAAAGVYVILRFSEKAGPDSVNRRRLAGAVALMVLLGAVLTGFQAWGYYQMSMRYSGGLTVGWDRFPLAGLGRFLPAGPLANVLDAPWLILVDFGLGAVACVLISGSLWRAFWRDPGMRMLIIASVLGIAAMFTVRSDVNRIDYGFRVAVMPAMVLAAVCAGALLEKEKLRAFARSWRLPVLIVGGLAGLPVGLYEAPVSAVRSLVEVNPLKADAAMILFLRDHTPRDAVIQGDPRARAGLVQLIDRPMGVLDPDYAHVAVFQPNDGSRMHKAFTDVEKAFATSSSQIAYRKLRAWAVQYVLAGSAERHRFGSLDHFRNTSLFETVYYDGRAAVYRLTDAPPGDQENKAPGRG